MWTRILLMTGILIGGGWVASPPSQASCIVDTATYNYADGTPIHDDKCDATGAKRSTVAGSAGASATSTAAAPTYVEGSTTAPLSLDLSGNQRVTLGTLLACEDQTNTLCMVSGGAVRTFNLMTGVTTNTTSATQIVHSGGKTILASVVGTGAQTATVDIFGDSDNTTGNGIWLCTVVLSGTTRATGSCNHQITKDYPYYHAVTSGVTGTGATVQVDAIVGAIGAPQSEFKWSGLKVADALIKTGPGFLQCIIFSQHDAAPTAGTISINDATSAGTGTVIVEHVFTTAVFMPVQICPQTGFTTGLYIDFTTIGDGNAGVSFR